MTEGEMMSGSTGRQDEREPGVVNRAEQVRLALAHTDELSAKHASDRAARGTEKRAEKRGGARPARGARAGGAPPPRRRRLGRPGTARVATQLRACR
jgi:hypothetical protein